MSKNVRLISILLSALVLVAGQQDARSQVEDVRTPPQQPTVQMPSDLVRVLTDYEDAWRSRNAAVLARLFAEDGFVLPNGFSTRRLQLLTSPEIVVRFIAVPISSALCFPINLRRTAAHPAVMPEHYSRFYGNAILYSDAEPNRRLRVEALVA